MQEFPKLQKRYDHIIVGYNLASMTFAYELSKKQTSFVVIDAKHLGSSPIKRLASLDAQVSSRVAFNPSFEALEEETPIWGDIQQHEGTPSTFDKGQFKSFLGFGDKKITSLEAVLPYCRTSHWVPSLTTENYWERLLENTQSHIFLDQQVTDVEYSEEAVHKLILNGKTALEGSHFYFFDHFDFLFDKMANEMKKQASQFAKVKWHSSVSLMIHHKEAPEVFDTNEIYLLMGSKEQPCIGQFLQVQGALVSRWESFFPSELAADAEMTGAMVKEIKKQIKRAFSFAEKTKDFEHVLVHERVYGNFEKSNIENGPISHFANLFVFSPLFDEKMGWAEEVRCGQKAFRDFIPNDTSLEVY